MTRILLTLVVLAWLPLHAAPGRTAHSRELDRLDDVLSQKSIYEQYLLERTDILKGVLSSLDDPVQIYEVNRRIADEFFSYSMDSTMHYLSECSRIAEALGDKARIIDTKIMMAEEYTTAGYHLEASGILAGIDSTSVPDHLLHDYYEARHNLAGELLAYASDTEMFDLQDHLREHYRNLLLQMAEPESYEWYYLKREEHSQYNRTAEALECSAKLLELSEEGTHDYAVACYLYQELLDVETSRDEKIEWLIRSATADIMCATRDYASLMFLARHLFSMGDIDRAFAYTAEHCMPDAIAFGGKLRPWQIVRFFPGIGKAYQEKNQKWQHTMYLMVGIMAALIVLMGFLVVFIFMRQVVLDKTRKALSTSYMEIERKNSTLMEANARLSELNSKILESDKIKQEYITLFLGILSENINTTRQYKNHVQRYIRMGNTQELVAEIEALPPIDNDINEFYKMFDRTFLNLYPDFVDKVNSLLAPGEEIALKSPEALTPELRVFALIKLGITDSGKIAPLLHYSANTVYNYRAKIRNKARGDRALFEDAVRTI